VLPSQRARVQCLGDAQRRWRARIARAPAFDRGVDITHYGLSFLGEKTASERPGAVKFSIITACRNSAAHLPATIQSVIKQSALAQGMVSAEYLIIDGASTDATAEVVSRYRHDSIVFTSEPDSGLYDAVAKGLAKAAGDVVAYLNAGDIFHEHAFRVVSEVMKHNGVEWICGYQLKINEAGEVIAVAKPPRYRREFILNGTYLKGFPYAGIQQEGIFFRRKLLDAVDLEKLKRFRLAGDYFLWTQLANQAELHTVLSFLGAFRVHRGQLSESLDAYRKEAETCTRAETFRERVTRYWEYHSPALLKGVLWNFTLGQSAARIIRFDETKHQWVPR
jgi:glycosyltransferase involved in cell wall biosynthesis